MSSRSKGEQIFLSQDRESSSDDENITLIQMLFQRRYHSERSSPFCKPLAMILPETQGGSPSTLSTKVPVRVTRSIKRTRDLEILVQSTKKTRTIKCKSSPSSTTVEKVDDVFDTLNSRKRKKISPKPKYHDHVETDDDYYA